MAKKKKYSLGDKFNYHHRRFFAPSTLRSKPNPNQQSYSFGFSDACNGIDNRRAMRKIESRASAASYASGYRNAQRAIKRSGMSEGKLVRMFQNIMLNISRR